MIKPVVKNVSLSECIKSMWRNWLIPVGAIMMIFILASFADKYVVASATMLAVPVLMQVRRAYKARVDTSMCLTTTVQVAITLFISSLLMFFAMWALRDYSGAELNGQPYNPDIPYLTTILIAAVCTLVTGVVWVSGINRRRMQRYGFKAGYHTSITMFRAGLLNREAVFHTKLLCIISLVITIIGSLYYFSLYINTNISHRDITVYAITPAIIYLLSLIYLAIRYYSFYAYYCHNEYLEMIDRGGCTTVRYMLLNGDRMFLVPRSYDTVVKYDTPSSYTLPYRARFGLYDAINLLREHAELREGCTIEPAYQTDDEATRHNVFHYFVYLNDEYAVKQRFPEGNWYSLASIQQMFADGALSTELALELHRIHTIAMAFKTYDREGRRLYKIKNYKPTFRLKDLPKWDVDYNDDTWLRISRDNQDRPFFTLRRLVRRFLNAISSEELKR